MVFPHLCGAVYLCGAFPNTLAADQLYKEQIVYLAVLIRQKKTTAKIPVLIKWSSCGKPNSFYNPKIQILMGRLPCCQHEWENHRNKWGSLCS